MGKIGLIIITRLNGYYLSYYIIIKIHSIEK